MRAGDPSKAKLFQHGGSQAVRLPKEFRFDASEVYVRRVGDEVILSARAKPSMRTLVEALDEFETGFELERAQPRRADRREAIVTKGSR
jgi:antitoxin VapB